MILEYQIEIISVIIILFLISAYLLMKYKKVQKEENLFETSQKTSYEQPEAKQPESKSLSQKQELQTEEKPQALQEKTDERARRKSDIIKRDVPQHGKITKHHFSEFAGVRILVAEDNIINQKVIAGLLVDSGIELVVANDGQEALDILQNDQNFLMVLMDAHMPRVDGFEATRIIRESPLYGHIAVVALSGDTAVDDIKKMSEAGMEDHLEKPLRMGSLYDLLYAYSGPQQAKEKTQSDYIEVPMTKELHGDKGLAVCGGDETFYFEILREFVTTYENSADELRTLLFESREAAADKLLLDVIGVSANIGAEHFRVIATNLKDSLHDAKEQSYYTNLEQYQIHLRRLIQDIKEFLKK